MKRMLSSLFLTSLCYFAGAQCDHAKGTFVVTDKQIYTPGETLYFTGYLLNFQPGDTATYHTLYLALADGQQRLPVICSPYWMELGISAGSIEIPKDLPSGDYSLHAFTNNLLQDSCEQDFYQWISIRKYGQEPVVASSFTSASIDTAVRWIRREPAPTARVTLSTDSSVYHRRSQVSCKLRVTDSTGTRIKGYYTVSCALDRRRQTEGFWNMRRYYYVDRYQNLMDSSVHFTVSPCLLNPLVGYITKNNKIVNKRIPLKLLTSNGVFQFKTDSIGVFNLPSTKLLASSASKGLLSVSKGSNSEFFTIHFLDIAARVCRTLAQRPLPYLADQQADSAVFSPQEMEYWSRHADQPGDSSPLKSAPSFTGTESGHIKRVNLIAPAKAFPMSDNATDSLREINLNTTLYWNYFMPDTESEDTSFSFITGDIPGTYTCTIQGYSDQGLVCTSIHFTVL
ncbi:hypothetical protein [Chitinophaga sp. Ak27]|uniref:hypothetical protein n=1 Tax=Chitinophaga sp. Ak27 TaxID=2726116 RepID=UPI00145EC8AA|nr:hypothetical protein [Chitinophaga sp. Ak27]NLU94885.1 hypothetical protein [Chitinophaga sp. Ak27]